MAIYGRLCGWTRLVHMPYPVTALRSPRRSAGSSAAFDNAIAAFAELYMDQNERDYDALRNKPPPKGGLRGVPGLFDRPRLTLLRAVKKPRASLRTAEH